MDTPSVLKIEATIEVVGSVVGDPKNWLALPVDSEIRIYNSFDECTIPLYEFLLTRIGLWLPFSDFEVVVLKHLKVPLS